MIQDVNMIQTTDALEAYLQGKVGVAQPGDNSASATYVRRQRNLAASALSGLKAGRVLRMLDATRKECLLTR